MNNIIICGVGGQGIVLTSKLIAAASMSRGLSVMSAETIGMAQKGGAVTSFLRTASPEKGEEIFSPIFEKGKADVMIAFEPAEAVRNISWLREGGKMIVNTHAIMPVTAALTGGEYRSEDMLSFLREKASHGRIELFAFDCEALTHKVGSPKVLNMLMLSAAVKCGAAEGITAEDIVETMKKTVKPQFVELNLRALTEDIVFDGD